MNKLLILLLLSIAFISCSNSKNQQKKNYEKLNLIFNFSCIFISSLPPFHVNTKKRLIKSPKLYIRDSGILHYLTDTLDFNDLLGNVIIGASWEGYVIE